MGIFGRIKNLINGKADRAIENAEKDDPDAIFRSAIQEEMKTIDDLRELARETKGLELSEVQQIANCKSKLEDLEQELEMALDQNDKDLGSELIMAMDDVRSDIEVNENEKAQYAEQAKQVIDALDVATKNLETLKKEHREAQQLEKSHDVMSKVNSRLNGTGTDNTSIALENARNRSNAIKADQMAMGQTKKATLESKRAALREKAKMSTSISKFDEMMKNRQK